MPSYRFLKPHFIDNRYFEAGEIYAAPGGWLPSIDVEPLDAAAATDYFAAGPREGSVIRTQFQGYQVPKPTTYWYKLSPHRWALSGLGAGLGTKCSMHVDRVMDK